MIQRFHSLEDLFGPHKRLSLALICLLIAVLLLAACSTEEPPNTQPASIHPLPAKLAIADEEATQKSEAFWALTQNTLAEAQQQTRLLATAIGRLLDAPSASTLQAARNEWRKAYTRYQHLEPFLLIESQTEKQLFTWLAKWRFRLAAWPIQPGYLDAFGVYAQSGLVNDITLPITATNLRKQHGLTDEEEITLGFHAIEFLLWGEASKRTAKAFEFQTKVPLALSQAGLKPAELPNNRRRLMLKYQAELLLKDFDALAKGLSNEGALATSFKQLSSTEKILTINRGLENYLKQLKVKWKRQDSSHDEYLRLNTFSEDHTALHSMGLPSISRVYFGEKLDLASYLFPLDTQEQIQNLLSELETTRRIDQLQQLAKLLAVSPAIDKSPKQAIGAY